MPETSDRQDPIVAFRFEIRIDNLAAGGFSECTGLQIETEVMDYAEGGLNTHMQRFPGRSKQPNLVLKRGIAGRVLHDWYLRLVAGDVDLKNGSILVYDPSGDRVESEWEFERAFPCKWNGPDLNAQQSSVAMESLEICHHGLVRSV